MPIRVFWCVCALMGVCAWAGTTPSTVLGKGVFRGQKVAYEVKDGIAQTEGDILLGPPDQLTGADGEGKQPGREAIAISGARYRWPDGVIPYVIDPSLPNQKRVTDAVQQWNERTALRLVPRTDQVNYVRFTRPAVDTTCNSFVGMIGGGQTLNLGDRCSTGNAVHEIGHAVGLYHEQSRQDRAYYLNIRYANIDKRYWDQYRQVLNGGEDVGSYDFASIMHYSSGGFASNDGTTMDTIPLGIPIGLRGELSAGDLDAVQRLYGQSAPGYTITSNPPGLQVVVDGETVTTPQTFAWPAGSRHRLAVVSPQVNGNQRYVFARWNNDGEVDQTIAAGSDLSYYTANFAVQYRMPVLAGTGGRVELSPEPVDGYMTAGTVVTAKAIPDEGRNFRGWTGIGYFSVHGAAPNPLVVRLDSSQLSYTAAFTTTSVTTLTADRPGLKVQVDGTSVTLPQGFLWAAGTKHTVSVADTSQTMGNATERYLFSGWDDDGANSRTVSAVAGGETIRVPFRRQYLVTANGTSSLVGSVAIAPSAEDDFYDEGTALQFTPTPRGSYQFASWSGDLSGADLPGALVVDGQKSVTGAFGIPGQINAGGVVSAGSFLSGAVAPGQLVSLFGLQIGPATPEFLQLDQAKRVSTSLGNTRVLFDGTPAPLVFVSGDQINAIVPFSVEGRTSTRVQVESNGRLSGALQLPVAVTAPALFSANGSGNGQGAFLNQDGSVNSPSSPAARGSVLVLYATGAGALSPRQLDGQLATPGSLPRPVLPVQVRLGRRPAVVEYAGGAPGLVAGVLQINIRVPADCPSGNVPVELQIGEYKSYPTTSASIQ